MRWLWILLAGWPGLAQSRESIEKQLQSVARQREALRKQGVAVRPAPAGVDESTAAVAEPPPVPSCDPVPADKLSPMIESAAKNQQLPAKLLRAIAGQESGFRACAVSKKGAQGLMQLMPATAEELEVEDPFDPAENLAAGAKFLRQLLEKYKGDLTLSLAAYNAGAATVDEKRGIPDIKETHDYVDAILREIGVKQIDLPNILTPKPIEN